MTSAKENQEILDENITMSDESSEFEVVSDIDDSLSAISNDFDMDYYVNTESEDAGSASENEEDKECKRMEGISFYFYGFENITYKKPCSAQCKIAGSKKNEGIKHLSKGKIERKIEKQLPTQMLKVPHTRKPVFSRFVQDKNPIVDGFLCSYGSYKRYAQKVCSGLEALLFSSDQISILYEHNHLIRRKMGNTLKIVATPNLVRNLHDEMDPLVLYSLVGCLPKGEIIFPVADNIIRRKPSSFIECFFDEIKIHCIENERTWPFCKRLITDVDFEVISAVLNHFNQLNIPSYLKICYNMYFNKKGEVKRTIVLPQNLVSLQFSATNCSKYILNEIKLLVGEKRTKLIEFITTSIGILFNLFKISHCIIWFRRICIVLLSPNRSKRVRDCFNALTNHPRRMTKMNTVNADSPMTSESFDKLRGACKQSPFKDQFLKYYLHCRMLCINENMEESCSSMATRNEYFCPKLVKLLMNNCIAMLPFWSNIVGIKIEPNQFHTEQDSIIENFYNGIKQEHLGDKRLQLGQFIRGYGDFVQSQIKDLRKYYLNN